MSWLLKLLPPWAPFAAAGVALATLIGGYFIWQHHERSIGAAGVVADDQKAVIQRDKKDDALNAVIVPAMEATQSKAQAEVSATKEKIDAVPAAPALDPVFVPVVDSVRRLLAPYRGAPAP